MQYLEMFSAGDVTVAFAGQDVNAYDYAKDSLARLYPDASKRMITGTLQHADFLLEQVTEHDSGTTDVGRLVLAGSALAVALQGRRGMFNRWVDGIVPKGVDPELFWKNKTAPDSAIPRPVLPVSAAQIAQHFSRPASDEAHKVMVELIQKIGGKGGLYEGLEPNITKLSVIEVGTIMQYDQKISMLGHGNAPCLDTSLYRMATGEIILGQYVGQTLLEQSEEGDYSKGTLAHEIGHGFTADSTTFMLLGKQKMALLLSELLAEKAKVFCGYSSSMYEHEQALQQAIDLAAGYDVIAQTIDEHRQTQQYGVDMLMKNYAQRLIDTYGFVFAGLVLGAIPEGYFESTAQHHTAPKNDIDLLSQQPNGTYQALQLYAPQC